MPQNVRARDIRAWIKELGFERGVEKALTMMADEQAGARQNMMDCANLIDTCIKNLEIVHIAANSMKGKLDDIKRRDEQYRDIANEEGKQT